MGVWARTTRRERIVIVETVVALAGLAVVVALDLLVAWLVWALLTVAGTGLTLLRFNWGFDPPPVDE